MIPPIIESILDATIMSGTTLLAAALGELYAERSGVLNLGVEGMMAMGAMVAFATAFLTKNLVLGVTAAIFAGAFLALIHAFLTITLRADQVASGLALTILGLGLSDFFGRPFTGLRGSRFEIIRIPLLSDLPIVGSFFEQDPIVYLSYLLTFLLWFILFKTSTGLCIRSVGESPETADVMGVNVFIVRYACVLFGGALAGLAGAYITLVQTPMWFSGITAGRGWIALALVIVSIWSPLYTVVGAYLFGALTAVYVFGMLKPLYMGRASILMSPWILQTTPYVATIVALVVISQAKQWVRAPSALTKPYRRE